MNRLKIAFASLLIMACTFIGATPANATTAVAPWNMNGSCSTSCVFHDYYITIYPGTFTDDDYYVAWYAHCTSLGSSFFVDVHRQSGSLAEAHNYSGAHVYSGSHQFNTTQTLEVRWQANGGSQTSSCDWYLSVDDVVFIQP